MAGPFRPDCVAEDLPELRLWTVQMPRLRAGVAQNVPRARTQRVACPVTAAMRS